MRTAFNILGPMLNPAVRQHDALSQRCTAEPEPPSQKAPYALVGVYTPQLLTLLAESLQVRAARLRHAARLAVLMRRTPDHSAWASNAHSW